MVAAFPLPRVTPSVRIVPCSIQIPSLLLFVTLVLFLPELHIQRNFKDLDLRSLLVDPRSFVSRNELASRASFLSWVMLAQANMISTARKISAFLIYPCLALAPLVTDVAELFAEAPVWSGIFPFLFPKIRSDISHCVVNGSMRPMAIMERTARRLFKPCSDSKIRPKQPNINHSVVTRQKKHLCGLVFFLSCSQKFEVIYLTVWSMDRCDRWLYWNEQRAGFSDLVQILKSYQNSQIYSTQYYTNSSLANCTSN